MKCSLLKRLRFKEGRTLKVRMSRRKLEICDWNIKEFPTKVQTWEAFGMVESKET